MTDESSIIRNEPCPACRETNHDKSGDHLMVFRDGSKYCKRAHFHNSRKNLYVPPDGKTVHDMQVSGDIKYSINEFREMQSTGKITPANRHVAIGGMRNVDAWEVMNTEERRDKHSEWKVEMEYFNSLRLRHLASRDINRIFCELYNVRVGLDEDNKTDRHYYPTYSCNQLVGASCRTLPKDFRYGTLGRTWGDIDLFGQNTLSAVSKKGRSMKTLIITGGQLDAMAANQMLTADQKGTFKDVPHHVWSVTKGEKCMQQIIDKKDDINRFSEILLAFDHDEVGRETELKIARLFRGKCKSIPYPEKDPNACLSAGYTKQFQSAYWNPVDPLQNSTIKSVGDYAEKAKIVPEMGKSWPWPGMNYRTHGINYHKLIVVTAGTGVGKTEFTMQLTSFLADTYDEDIGAIYLENTGVEVVKKYAGNLIGKRLTDPPLADKSSEFYQESTDYTQEQSDNAIDRLTRKNKLFIAETGGNKSIEMVLECIDDFVAAGIRTIVIDNLTAIKIEGKGNTTDNINDAMMALGTYKDENPVTLILVSHLKKVAAPRVPHEDGGEIQLSDLRGAGSISFWANLVIGLVRNTRGELKDRLRTYITILKCRDRGLSVGDIVTTSMDLSTNKLCEIVGDGRQFKGMKDAGEKKGVTVTTEEENKPPKEVVREGDESAVRDYDVLSTGGRDGSPEGDNSETLF